MKSRKLVTSCRLALMASRALCLSVTAASPPAGRGARRRRCQHRRRRYRAKYTTLLTPAASDEEHKSRRRGSVSDNWRRVVRTFPERNRHTQDKKEALSPLTKVFR